MSLIFLCAFFPHTSFLHTLLFYWQIAQAIHLKKASSEKKIRYKKFHHKFQTASLELFPDKCQLDL